MKLVDEIEEAISEHHSGNIEEGRRIAQAAIDVIERRLLSDEIVELMTEYCEQFGMRDTIKAVLDAVKGGDV